MVEWALANLWAWAVQAAALVALGVWLPMRLRLGTPRVRLVVFRTLLVACVALPLAQPWAPALSPVVAPEVAPPAIELTVVDAGGAGLAPPAPAGSRMALLFERVRTATAALPWGGIALVVLVGGAILRLGWLGLGLLSLARLRRSSSPIDPDLPVIREAERAVGVRASVRKSSRVRHPVTFGLRRPVVLVPPGFVALEPRQQLAIVCHELLHVRRQDWLRAIGDELVRALLWFHPGIWWLVEQIRLSAEQLIDRQVVGLIADRRSYLRALLVLAEAGTGPRLQLAPSFFDHGHLKQRVAMLMEEVSMSRLRVVVSGLLVASILATGGWAVLRAFPLRAAAVGQLPTPPPPPVPQVAPAPPPPPPPPAPASKAPKPEVLVLPEQPQGAPRPGMPTASPKVDEASLKQGIKDRPTYTWNYFALAKLYEDGGDLARAVETLEAAAKAVPNDSSVYMQLAGFHNRHGDFEQTMDALTRWAAVEPGNPVVHYTMAVYYWEKAFRDGRLAEVQKRDYIDRGLQAGDRAISLNPEYYEALTYKNLLLRSQALLERDPEGEKRLIAEADELRNRAIEIRNQRSASGMPTATYPPPDRYIPGGEPAPPPPPPPPPPPAKKLTDGVRAAIAPVSAAPPLPPPPPPPPAKKLTGEVQASDAKVYAPGNGVREPVVIREVRPQYVPDAMRAKVEGTVLLTVVVGTDGTAGEVEVMRSLRPDLDEQAILAAKQWRFEPGTKDGAPVPVRVLIELTFTLK